MGKRLGQGGMAGKEESAYDREAGLVKGKASATGRD